MRSHRVWLETCKFCNPWTRVIGHPTTNEPIVQALHEDHCHAFPKRQRTEQAVDPGGDKW